MGWHIVNAPISVMVTHARSFTLINHSKESKTVVSPWIKRPVGEIQRVWDIAPGSSSYFGRDWSRLTIEGECELIQEGRVYGHDGSSYLPSDD